MLLVDRADDKLLKYLEDIYDTEGVIVDNKRVIPIVAKFYMKYKDFGIRLQDIEDVFGNVTELLVRQIKDRTFDIMRGTVAVDTSDCTAEELTRLRTEISIESYITSNMKKALDLRDIKSMEIASSTMAEDTDDGLTASQKVLKNVSSDGVYYMDECELELDTDEVTTILELALLIDKESKMSFSLFNFLLSLPKLEKLLKDRIQDTDARYAAHASQKSKMHDALFSQDVKNRSLARRGKKVDKEGDALYRQSLYVKNQIKDMPLLQLKYKETEEIKGLKKQLGAHTDSLLIHKFAKFAALMKAHEKEVLAIAGKLRKC